MSQTRQLCSCRPPRWTFLEPARKSIRTQRADLLRSYIRLTRCRLYQDQLNLTERHLSSLISDADSTLQLLTSLSNSFQSVETQTSTFQAHCEDLLKEQRRLEKLADEVGTDLHYYEYLEQATRRLNAAGASRLVDDESFGDIIDNIDACTVFMGEHVSQNSHL